MRVLLITNKVNTYALGFQNTIQPLLDLGHEVTWAADFSGFKGDKNLIPCKIEQISIRSNPLAKENRAAFKDICRVIQEKQINAIQCSTPIGGLLGRLAGKKMHVRPVIYVAHGFLFFKGAPLINRTLYKLEEDWLGHYTDVLVTIIEEDYNASQRIPLRKGGQRFMIHGAGVEVGKIIHMDVAAKRRELGVASDEFLVTSGGFLNSNKNNRVVIEAVSMLKERKIHYLVCGEGEKKEELKSLTERLGVTDQVSFLGFRTDFDEILVASDAFVMPSFREGVPRALLEAMDLGKPCVGADTRGIRDLIQHKKGGFICNPRDGKSFAEAFSAMMDSPEMCCRMGEYNRGKTGSYSYQAVRNEMTEIYKKVLQKECNAINERSR